MGSLESVVGRIIYQLVKKVSQKVGGWSPMIQRILEQEP